MDYDAVVVGAGPVGSAAARDIARAGFKTLLLEEHKKVGKPTFCSGLVTPRTLELASISDGVVINTLKGALVHSASGKELKLGGDKVHAVAIDRAAFDQKLAEQAQEEGADLLLESRLIHIERQGRYVSLGINQGGRSIRANAKLLKGADGAYSRVARWMNGPSSGETITAVSVDTRLKTRTVDQADIFVAKSIAPGWFGWNIPLGNGVARVGIGDGTSSAKPLNQLLKELVYTFPRQLEGIELGRFRGHAIPIYSPIKTYNDNALLVGDAARQVKPTSGGGIYTGLVGAKHCAIVAADALKRDDLSESFLSRYETSWRGELGDELERGMDLRRVFVSLSDREIGRLLTLLARPPFLKIINRFGDIDFQSPLFGHLVEAMPLLRLFIRFPFDFLGHWKPWFSDIGES